MKVHARTRWARGPMPSSRPGSGSSPSPCELFFEHAYEDVTLAGIAKAAGVSHQTVLNHFESKEGVVARRRRRRWARRRPTPATGAEPGDVAGAVTGARRRVRAHRRRQRPLGDDGRAARHPRRPLIDEARASHQAWLRHMFGARVGATGAGPPADRQRPARGDRRLHVEVAAPRPRPEPGRDREDHRPHSSRASSTPPARSAHDRHANAYLFALVDGGGTVPPELAAARRLVERGHAVTVLAEDSMEPDVRATGATFRRWVEAPEPARPASRARPVPRLGVLQPAEAVRPAARPAVRRPGPAATSPTSTPAIAERRPDLVVCSQFAFGAMMAAEAAGIPFDVLMPNIYLLPSPGMTPIGSGTKPARGRSDGPATG